MLVQSQSDTHSNFINSIKSDVTKKIYEYNLRLFMEFCSVHQYEDLMDQENKIIPAVISKTIFPLFRAYRELGGLYFDGSVTLCESCVAKFNFLLANQL